MGKNIGAMGVSGHAPRDARAKITTGHCENTKQFYTASTFTIAYRGSLRTPSEVYPIAFDHRLILLCGHAGPRSGRGSSSTSTKNARI